MSVFTINGVEMKSDLIQKPVRGRRSMAVGTFTFTAKQAVDANPLWAFKTPITIQKDGAKIFQGVLTQPRARGEASSEEIEYQVSDLWWLLERCIYQQNWYNRGLYPRVILNLKQSDSWAPSQISCGAQIIAALTYAISCGVNLQVGVIEAGPTPPIEERVSITVAEVIKGQLRWMPDHVFQVDYSTTPVTVNVVRRGAGGPVNFSVGNPPLEGIPELTPLPELLVPQVVIYYEQKNTDSDGKQVTQITPDTAPAGSTGTVDGSIIQCIELAGSNAIFQKNSITTASVPWGAAAESGSTDVNKWFISHDPRLAKIKPEHIEVVQNSFWNDLPAGQKDQNGNDLTGFTLDNLNSTAPRELLPGSQVARWQAKPAPSSGPGSTTPGDGYIHALKVDFAVSLSFLFTATGVTNDEKAAAQEIFGKDNNYDISFSIVCTNALTQEYTKLTSYAPGETVPAGIAASLHAALSVLHWRGNFALHEQECGGLVSLAGVINIGGGNAAWAAMNAMVQQVVEDYDRGKTKITCGPPDHLSPQDIVELLRQTRAHQVSTRASEQSTGHSGQAPTVDQTAIPGQTNTTPNIPRLPETPFQVVDAGHGNIGVVSNSHVINQADKDTWEQDNSGWGLLSDDRSSGGFAIPSIGSKIWLRFTFDSSQNLTAVDLKHESAWSQYPDPIYIDTSGTPYQKYYHALIAEVSDPDSDPRDGLVIKLSGGAQIKIVQLLSTNLQLVPALTTDDADQANLPIIIAVPMPGPGTATSGGGDEINDQTDVKTPWQFGQKVPGNDFALYNAGSAQLGIKNGTVNGNLPSGMSAGGDPAYEQGVGGGDTLAWLVVTASYSAGVTSVTLDTGTSLPSDTLATGTGSGTYYLALGTFSVDGDGKVSIGSGAFGIGSQVFSLCRDWFSSSPKYSASWGPA